jgi:hypothetical protein
MQFQFILFSDIPGDIPKTSVNADHFFPRPQDKIILSSS